MKNSRQNAFQQPFCNSDFGHHGMGYNFSAVVVDMINVNLPFFIENIPPSGNLDKSLL
jgi:hypothetical protein